MPRDHFLEQVGWLLLVRLFLDLLMGCRFLDQPVVQHAHWLVLEVQVAQFGRQQPWF